MKQNVYLKSTPLEKVLRILKSECPLHQKTERINIKNSLHRITYDPVIAEVSSPVFNASAMDGVMVVAAMTEEATETNPVTLSDQDFVYVNTGNPVNEPYNAVIKLEDLIENNTTNRVTIIKSASPYQHIRPIGEDVIEKTVILPKYHKIRPIDIAAMLAGGVETITVLAKPKVCVIPTGDEIIRDVKKLTQGKILDSNSFYLENELLSLGVDVTIHDIVADDYPYLESVITNASLNYDLVLIGAGSSSGSKDFAKSIVEKHGQVFVHGIAIKPGKPTIIGKINNATVIGLPGYPVSTFIAFECVVKPLLFHYFHQHLSRPLLQAKITGKLVGSLESEEYVRVKLNKVKDNFIATPLSRGAGVTTSVVQADGLLIIPRHVEGYDAYESVTVWPLKTLEMIENTITVIGSHDILLDEIDALLRHSNIILSSTHVGSFGGVQAIKTDECHIAPIHLLDAFGQYNRYVIDKYLSNDFVIIRGVDRIQGLYTKASNPKNIGSISDLTRQEIRFVNRQRGSGTRIFFDNLLKTNAIKTHLIHGYSYELPTHTMVASAIKEGAYDAGVGIESVAKLYGLNFIELGVEQYDFLVHKSQLKTNKVKAFIAVLKGEQFKQKILSIGGYRIEDIGEIIHG